MPSFAPVPFGSTSLALVARAAEGNGVDRYLRLSPAGDAAWTDDAADATIFDSMREATRAAMRLPAGLRAFGLPRGPVAPSPSTH